MRSYVENHGFLPEYKLPGHIEIPTGMSRLEIEHWARHQRAAILGEHLADLFVWAFRLPGRLIAAWRRRDTSRNTAKAGTQTA